jgi:C-terminal domain of 1-Cys peroxiredoxin
VDQAAIVVPPQILRVIDSLQLTAKHSVATPVNWDHGQDVVIVPTISDEAAKDKVPLFLHDEGIAVQF